MNSYSEHKFLFWPMSNGKLLNFREEMKGHGSDFRSVLIVVANRKTADLKSNIKAQLQLLATRTIKSIGNFSAKKPARLKNAGSAQWKIYKVLVGYYY